MILLFGFILAVLLPSSFALAADDWQLQENHWTGEWRPRGSEQFADKVTCARGATEAVTNGGVNKENIRCRNSSTTEVVGWAALERAITDAEAVPPPPGPACRVETPDLWPIGYWGSFPSLLPCGGSTGIDCLECGICGLLMLGQRIIYVMISAIIFVIAPIRFLWGGFLILVSRGSSESVGRGKKMIYNTVIGLLIGMGAFLIVQTFLWLLGGAGLANDQKLGWPTINCQRNLN